MVHNTEKSRQAIRASSVLTASYVPATVISIDDHNYLGLEVLYTKGNETSLEIKIEVSSDGGTNYSQQVTESTTGGTTTVTLGERKFTATGDYSVIAKDIQGTHIKVSAKATGGTPTGTLAMEAVTSYVNA